MKEENNEKKINSPNASLENIQDLRSKSFKPETNPDLKKNIFGRYNTREVNDYVKNLNIQNNRTIATYQERIDEFTSFIEMLNKEKEDIIKSYENTDIEISKLKEKCENYESDINAFKKEIDRLNSEMSKIVNEYSRKMKEMENEFGISKENELLKEEIKALSVSRDNLQSANSMIKAEFETTRDDLEKMKSENKKLRDDNAILSSRMRKYRMNQNMKIIEFSEREIFTLKKTEEKLSNLVEDIRKMTEDTMNFQQNSAEEIDD